MIVVSGRIVNFFGRKEWSNSLFIFKSDYDKNCPRFYALCDGKIPDVVPGVPMKVEFPVNDLSEVKKFDIWNTEILTKSTKEKFCNRIAYACIDYSDEEYAKTLLVKVKGISGKTAEKILDAVDGDIGRLADLWDDKDFWKRMKGSKKYYSELKDTVGTMLQKDILFKKYGKYGIGYPQIDMLSAMYGLEAEQKLCDSPYSVMYKLDLDFQVSDYFAKDLGFDYLSESRVRAIVNHVLKRNEKNGNTAMKQKDFFVECARLHRSSAWKDQVVSPYYILAIVSAMNHVYYEDGMIGFLSTMEKEVDIVYELYRLMNAQTELHTPESVFEEIKDKYNKEQLQFLREFDKSSVVILLGRGGTGKTHTICGAIDLFKRQNPDGEVRLCAPTARAAGVLKEHSGHESSTIHIMLGLSPYKSEKDEEVSLLDAKMIVVDEMSMVDTDLMWHLIKAVKSGAKLILSGDPDQLESVGCGAVLYDMISSNMVPKVKLKKIMRQSEGSAVIENCGKILSGRFDFLENDSFKIRFCGNEKEALMFLKSCYSGDPINSQIISTTKKGFVGTMAINKEFEDPKQEGVWMHGDFFKKGDKVVFTKNNYDKGYCNGDIGFVDVAADPLIVKLNNVFIEVDKDDAANMEHADAITIHKSQGSEYKDVYILLPDDPKVLLTRNMVNTAISRARQTVTLIVVNDALEIAASNKYKKKRITRLKEKLENAEVLKCEKEKRKTL